MPEISRFTFEPRNDFSTLGSQVSAPARLENVSSWIPSCAHWTILNLTRKSNTVSIPIVKVSSGQLRFLWHIGYDLFTQLRHPPLALPHSLLLQPQYWKTFWSLTIPPKAFTPWFRLLHGCIPTAALQHAWNPSVTASPLCRLCQQDIETHHHFFVSYLLNARTAQGWIKRMDNDPEWDIYGKLTKSIVLNLSCRKSISISLLIFSMSNLKQQERMPLIALPQTSRDSVWKSLR